MLEQEDPLERARRLAKRRIALLFYESSTRTRTSFELAAKGLGVDTTLVSSLSSSIEKGETLKDTGLTLRALGAEAIILRHPNSGAPWLLERETGLPVLNAGDGMHEHPSQALLDLRTMLAHLRPGIETITAETLAGVTISITGDILHSRVARSNMLLLPKLGARVLLCGPRELLPETAAHISPCIEGPSMERPGHRRDRARLCAGDCPIASGDDAAHPGRAPRGIAARSRRVQGWLISSPKNGLAAHAPKALVMHPGPIIRGLELTGEVADGPQSLILEQVHHGVAIRMALVYRALTQASSAKKEAVA